MTLAQPKDTPISDELRAALQWWLEQAESKRPMPRVKVCGLCSALTYYKHELRAVLRRQFGQTDYPFGQSDYHSRQGNGTQHLCPKRLAWVRAMIAEAPRKEVE